MRHFYSFLFTFKSSQQTDVCSWESLITLWAFLVSCDLKWLLLNLCKQVLWIHTQSTWRGRSWAQQRGTRHSPRKTVRHFISLFFFFGVWIATNYLLSVNLLIHIMMVVSTSLSLIHMLKCWNWWKKQAKDLLPFFLFFTKTTWQPFLFNPFNLWL